MDEEIRTALAVIDGAMAMEGERRLSPGSLVSAIFCTAAATLAHQYGWTPESLIDAVTELTASGNLPALKLLASYGLCGEAAAV